MARSLHRSFKTCALVRTYRPNFRPFTPLNSLNLVLGAVPNSSLRSAVQLSHLRPDGTPAWLLRLLGRQLSVECTRYSRWEKVWGAAHRYLEAGLEVIEEQEPSRKIALLGQTFIDTFLAERDDYDLSALLKRESPLADKVFSSGSTWHSHVGWFERLDCLGTNVPWLNQLNLDAVSSLHPGTSQPIKPRVQVTHNQELRLPAPVSLEDAKSELDSRRCKLYI